MNMKLRCQKQSLHSHKKIFSVESSQKKKYFFLKKSRVYYVENIEELKFTTNEGAPGIWLYTKLYLIQVEDKLPLFTCLELSISTAIYSNAQTFKSIFSPTDSILFLHEGRWKQVFQKKTLS